MSETDWEKKIKQLEKNTSVVYEKQIAHAILDAQKMREESYVPGAKYADGDLVRSDFGEYTKDFEECFQVACKVNCLSPNMWSLLVLANHWINDVQLWAEDVLAGKNILEEAEKEKAKMEDGIKHIDDVVNNSRALSAELAEMQKTLRRERTANGESKDKGCLSCKAASAENCSQCRDTDSSGAIKNS